MEINKRNRKELKSYFVKNAIPSESNFGELIDAMLNQNDDGIAKLAGDPLSIEASGDDQSQKKVINFYKNFTDTKPEWVFSLNPRSNPSKPETARPGFSISDADGNSRLFIDKNGNIGVGTNTPGSYKFNIGATGGQNVLHLASDFGLRGDNKINLIKFGNDGDYQILHKASGALGRNTLAMHVHTSDSFGVYSSGWLPLFEVEGGTGDVYVRGSVGAGTTDPKGKLHAVGDLVLGLDANNKKFIFHPRTNGNGDFLQITHDKTDGNWDWGQGITLRRGGNVGIGTTGPGYALEVSGDVFARDGVIVGNRNTHINIDGAFYRYAGQGYITVDDNLYIRDSGGGIKFHFDTNNGVIKQEGWKSLPLINSWVNYGGGYTTAAYFKDKMGTVHLRGLIKNGTNGHIGTLPSGYRTSQRKLFAATTNPNAHGRVDVLNDGRVFAIKYDKGWLSLDGISFRVI